jgi:heme/copper-type cytochrome/quinol oxidase subunit 3
MSTMTEQRPLELIHPPPSAEERQMLPPQVLGTGIFVLTEVMFFAGLISAFTVTRAGAAGGIWPPPGQPMLPVTQTLFNTVALVLSGVALWYAGRRMADNPAAARRPFQVAVVLGLVFVVLQGVEWVGLLAQGLTLTSSTYGSFFYLIVGVHGLHVLVGVAVLLYVYSLLHTRQLSANGMKAMQLYWFFVVGLWPILYATVYF